jgi:hypothetical protein
MMKKFIITTILLTLFPAIVLSGEREDKILNEKLIPLIQDFIQRNGLPDGSEIATNKIKRRVIDFYDDGRIGGQGTILFTNGLSFGLFWNENAFEVRHFTTKTKTYYHLDFAPKEQLEAVIALNLRNKLNDKTALELARKYFRLQGHKEKDFHPPELFQECWTGGPPEYKPQEKRRLPYYRVDWYRKDVKPEDKDPVKGKLAMLPCVDIVVSGIDSNLVSYSKISLPVGKDF